MDESPRKWYFAKQFLAHNNNELKIFNENICLSPTTPMTSFKAVHFNIACTIEHVRVVILLPINILRGWTKS